MQSINRRLVPACAAAAILASSPALGQIDLTGDGRMEIAFGDPGLSTLTMLDGATGHDLWRVADTDMFGWAASAHPDIDGDGRADVLVTAPGTGRAVPGRVLALRGHDGAVLWSCGYAEPEARFGLGVGVIPDQDLDGVADLLVAMLSDDPGGERAVLVSGRTGRVLAAAPGPMAPLLTAARNREFAFKSKDLDGSGVVDMSDVVAIAAAIDAGDDAGDLDFSGTADVRDLLKLVDSILVATGQTMSPVRYALLSQEDPLRYNDGYQFLAFSAPPFEPTPPSEPCAAERDAARLAALEWARHLKSVPTTLNPFEWLRWSDTADNLRDRAHAALALYNACRAQLGLPPVILPDLIRRETPAPPSPPSPAPPPPSRCLLDEAYPPPVPSPGSPQNACVNQLENNYFACMTCRSLQLVTEAYGDCQERAKAIFKACKEAQETNP